MSSNTGRNERNIPNSKSEDLPSRKLTCGDTPGTACLKGQSYVELRLSAGAFDFVRDNRRRITRLMASMRAVAVSNDTGKHSILGPTNLNATVRCYKNITYSAQQLGAASTSRWTRLPTLQIPTRVVASEALRSTRRGTLGELARQGYTRSIEVNCAEPTERCQGAVDPLSSLHTSRSSKRISWRARAKK